MKRVFMTSFVAVAVLLVVSSCRSSVDLSRAETQRQFGVRMAKMNLWREAMFRFQRAVELEPQNAMAHNNLAVAYEATGDFEAAATAYREALRLDRSNQYIQRNYSRYVEFTQRSKRREARPARATPATAPDEPEASEEADDASSGNELPPTGSPAGEPPAAPEPDSQPRTPPRPGVDPELPPDEPTPTTGGA